MLDIVKTNFAGDTDSLFMNLGDGSFDDRTYQAGLGINTRLLGWGISFIDIDNDGWLDILVANGHVYPEVDGTQVDAAYAERKYLYRNLRNGQFEDVSLIGGAGITTAAKARGFAVGDYDNDGDLDAVVNCVNAVPQLLRCDSTLNRSWVKIRLVGTKSNKTGIGARIKVVAQTGSPVLTAKPGTPLTQIEDVRSCNGYYSASDLRIHFGLNEAKKVDLVEIRWLSGQVDTLKDLDVNRLYVVEEGGKLLKNEALVAAKKKKRITGWVALMDCFQKEDFMRKYYTAAQSVRAVICALFLVCQTARCVPQQQHQPDFAKDERLSGFLRNYLGEHTDETSTTRYSAAVVDLRDDGKRETIVYLTGSAWLVRNGRLYYVDSGSRGRYLQGDHESACDASSCLCTNRQIERLARYLPCHRTASL